MRHTAQDVNPQIDVASILPDLSGHRTIAPLKNVAVCVNALTMVMQRDRFLPGMACFYGPAGWGKSFSAAYAANRFRAFYIECKSVWTKRAIVEAVLKEMGLDVDGPIYRMVERIAEHLVATGRPLIIDEFDHIVLKKAVEIVRDIYDASDAPILLIGEEMLPMKIRRWERFSSRVLHYAPAQPADVADARVLQGIYCPNVDIADDLMEALTKASKGSVRRIAVNLAQIKEFARRSARKELSLRDYTQPFYTGDAPTRRV